MTRVLRVISDALRRTWAANIRRARRARNLSQTALGEAVGVSQGTVSRWEAGRCIPEDENKAELGRALEVDPHVLFPLAVKT